MISIQREKAGQTHHATAIDDAGRVTGWTKDESKSVLFSEEKAKRAAEHYERRKEAGYLEFSDEDGRVKHSVGEDTEVRAPVHITDIHAENKRLNEALIEGAEHFDRLLKEKADLVAENELLREENEGLKKAVADRGAAPITTA